MLRVCEAARPQLIAMDTQGTFSDPEEGPSGGWVLLEAEEVDKPPNDSVEELFDCSDSESFISDLVDNASVHQGNSLALYQEQNIRDTVQEIQKLKRKLVVTPEEVASLSPRLGKISISPRRKPSKVKKQLFPDDSGNLQDEIPSVNEELQVEATAPKGGELSVETLLKCSNRRSILCGKFKDCIGVSISELTRIYRSDKTCSYSWVCGIYCWSNQIDKKVEESAHISLQAHCEFFYVETYGPMILLLCEFKAAKSRETLLKLLTNLLNVRSEAMVCDPPRSRSMSAALFWYQKVLKKTGYSHGSLPDWIASQCLLDHQRKQEAPFDLSEMVQWALDNDYTDEHIIAFEYACLGNELPNAAAFLRSINQPKHVRDCVSMVNHYLKAQNMRMSMSRYIYLRCKDAGDTDDQWRAIVRFLRYEGVEFFNFMSALQSFLKLIPKKQCLVFCGPSNTGKSFFATSLIRFFKGKVISYANSTSQFWISPLHNAKLGLLDDATEQCWNYLDIFLRSGLDGNEVSIDLKHKNLVQMKLPPLLITSNVDVRTIDKYRHLCTRLRFFDFGREFPLDAGEPLYKIDNIAWASFFRRFWNHLILSDQEDSEEENGADSQRSFRVSSRSNSGPL